MPTTVTFKQGLDFPRGRAVARFEALTSSLSSAAAIAYDLRGRDYRNPFAFFQTSSTILNVYNMAYDAFMNISGSTITTAGSITQSMPAVFCPSQGPSGTLSTGNTTTKIVLSTALPASVNVNQLANRGDGKGHIIRIIGNSAGGSGKTEERRIVGNTSGTTPTIQLNEALSFTPASGDRYEILSGRLFVIGAGSTTSGSFMYYDVATASVSAALSSTNQPSFSTSTNSNAQIISLDEAHVPYNRNPGEGFLVGAATYDAGSANWTKLCLTATASAAGTITGQASAGDASVLANEYRNFQIRIVEDTGTPTAVGQRRRITSHTAGASAVYTLASNWSVTPSATAKFVIENDNDKIISWNSGATVTYNYNITANTWDTSTWAARSVAHTYGPAHQSFSIEVDAEKNSRHSNIFSFRGNNTATYDIFNIAGGTTGSWTNGLSYFNGAIGNNQGIQATYIFGAQVPWTQEGRYVYLQVAMGASGTTPIASSIVRFDLKNRTMEFYTQTALFSALGGARPTNNMCASYYLDGSTYVSSVFAFRPGDAINQMCQYPILS